MDATTQTGCRVEHSFDPLSETYLQDPFRTLAALPHDREPFYAPVIDYYVVSRQADIAEVFRDHETYSAAAAQLPMTALVPEAAQILAAGGYKPQPTMVSLDAPAHARLRGPTARAFTPKRVAEMAPSIRSTVNDLLDALGPEDPFEVVSTLAFPLPATTIFTLLGVPADDYALLKGWCEQRAGLIWGRPDPAEQIRIATDIVSYRSYMHQLVIAKVDDPGNDLTSDLISIHDEAPDELTLDEIASILFSLSFAGHETSTCLIANAIRRLLEDPTCWHDLVLDPNLIPKAVEETLRFDSSVPAWRRITTRPTSLGGVALPEGAKLFLWLAAAGRDPSAFDSPDTFDLHRRDAPHRLAFGKGIHFCVGAQLGKLEAELALSELVHRFPHLRLVEEQKLSFHPNISFRGPQELWLERVP
jgi:cytochrome P450